MAITTIPTQPAQNSINAAYRPIILQATADNIDTTITFIENVTFTAPHTISFSNYRSFFVIGNTFIRYVYNVITGISPVIQTITNVTQTSTGWDIEIAETLGNYTGNVTFSYTEITSCPIVWCDIYINDVYYKSLSKTKPISISSTEAVFEFDIQDAVQEVMSYNLPNLDSSSIAEFTNTIKNIQCKFRNAIFDSNGFIKSEQNEPIQGDVPVSGDGYPSNSFYTLNATIQHEENQDLQSLLNGYKTGNWYGITAPLTKRTKKAFLCKNDSSFFPIVTDSDITCLTLNYRNKNQNNFNSVSSCAPTTCSINYNLDHWQAIHDTVDNTTQYIITFNTSTAPYDYLFEISIDGINWTVPSGLVITTGTTVFRYNLSGNKQAHQIRLKYFCNSSDSTSFLNVYYSNDYSETWSASNITNSSFIMNTGFITGVTFDVSLDNGTTWILNNQTSQSLLINGLSSGTSYQVVRRLHDLDGNIQTFGPTTITTL